MKNKFFEIIKYLGAIGIGVFLIVLGSYMNKVDGNTDSIGINKTTIIQQKQYIDDAKSLALTGINKSREACTTANDAKQSNIDLTIKFDGLLSSINDLKESFAASKERDENFKNQINELKDLIKELNK